MHLKIEKKIVAKGRAPEGLFEQPAESMELGIGAGELVLPDIPTAAFSGKPAGFAIRHSHEAVSSILALSDCASGFGHSFTILVPTSMRGTIVISNHRDLVMKSIIFLGLASDGLEFSLG